MISFCRGFTLIEKAEDCRTPFAQLEDNLNPSWEEMYRQFDPIQGSIVMKTSVSITGRRRALSGELVRLSAVHLSGHYQGYPHGDRIRSLNDIGFQGSPSKDRWMGKSILLKCSVESMDIWRSFIPMWPPMV